MDPILQNEKNRKILKIPKLIPLKQPENFKNPKIDTLPIKKLSGKFKKF